MLQEAVEHAAGRAGDSTHFAVEVVDDAGDHDVVDDAAPCAWRGRW